jgi:hypothetical protein
VFPTLTFLLRDHHLKFVTSKEAYLAEVLSVEDGSASGDDDDDSGVGMGAIGRDVRNGVRKAISTVFQSPVQLHTLPLPVPGGSDKLLQLDEPGGFAHLTSEFVSAMSAFRSECVSSAPVKALREVRGGGGSGSGSGWNEVAVIGPVLSSLLSSCVGSVNCSAAAACVVVDAFTAAMASLVSSTLARARAVLSTAVGRAVSRLPSDDASVMSELASEVSSATQMMAAMKAHDADAVCTFSRECERAIENVKLQHDTLSRQQCDALFRARTSSVDVQRRLDGCVSSDSCDAVLDDVCGGMRRDMVGPYKHSDGMAREMASWVTFSRNAVNQRLARQAAEARARYVCAGVCVSV